MNIFIDSLIKVVIRYPKFMESALLKKVMYVFPHRIANRYDKRIASRQDYELPLNEGLKHLHEQSIYPRQILDICSGTGFASITAAAAFPEARVTGIDQSPSMVDLAKQKADSRNVKTVQFLNENAFNLPFKDNEFDLVIVSNAPFYFDEIVRVLRANGMLLISLSFGGSGISRNKLRIEEYFQKYNLIVKEVKQIKSGAYILSYLNE